MSQREAQMTAGNGARWTWLIAAVVATYVVLVALTFLDYGITFDEEYHTRYGDMILAWYRSGFRDQEALSYWVLIYYGGFFDTVAQAATRFSPFGVYETRHLLGGLLGVFGVAVTGALATRLSGGLAGFLAALFLLLTPVYYGHSFNNPVDLPFAVMFLTSLYCMVRAIEQFPHPSLPVLAALALSIGLTIGVRFGGVVLFGCLGLAFLLWVAAERRRGGVLRPLQAALAFAPRWLGVVALAWAAMLVWWPKALLDPIVHPLRSFRVLGDYPWNHTVLFEGRGTPASELPWYYLPKWLLISAPEFLLLALAAALGTAAAALIRARRARSPAEPPGAARWIAFVTIILAAVLPVAYAVVRGTTVYDGLRHFLFIIPVFAVLGGCGVAVALRTWRTPLKWLLGGTLAASLTLTAAEMIRLHPYQYIFFNRSVAGGLSRAAASYETEYFGAAGREAARWVAAHYDRRDDGAPIRVATCLHRTSTAYYLPESRFVTVMPANSPDLFFTTTRFGCHANAPGKVVYSVAREGVPLIYVKQVTDRVAQKRVAGGRTE